MNQPLVSNSKHVRHYVLLIALALAIMLAAFGLRGWNLNTESIWHDEAWSIRAIHAPFTSPDDKTPFAYYAAMHLFWRAGIGESPFAYRYGSVLIGLMGVAMAMKLGWRWYGAGVGLAAGAMVAVSPLLWEYSQEVRAYIVVPLLALLMLYGVDRMLRVGRLRRRDWVLIFVTELVALYTHNLAVPLIAWVNLVLIIPWLFRRDGRRLGLWMIAQVALGIAYLPWLLTQSPSGTPLNTPPPIGLGLVRDIWYSYFLPVLPQLREAAESAALDALALLLLAGILVLLITLLRNTSNEPIASQSLLFARYSHRIPHTSFLLLSHVLLVPIFTTLLILAAHIDFHPRYYIAAVPATLILLAAGVKALTRLAVGRTLPSLNPIANIILVVLVSMVSLSSIAAISQNHAYQHDDFAGLAAYYAALPPDTVILLPFPTEPALQVYYAEQYDIKARFVNLPLYSDEPVVVPTINQLFEEGVHQVEFLTWYQLPADERGMYPCLLTAAGESLHEPHTFFGLSTQAYHLSQSLTLTPLDARPRYANHGLTEAVYIASDGGVCLRTSWDGEAESGLAVAAALHNPIDQDIARSDASIVPADPASSDVGSAYNLLHLPEAAPRMAYDLSLTLYDAAQPSGYDLLSDDGNPSGKIYTLNDAITAAGSPFSGQPPVAPILQSDNAGDNRTLESGLPLDITLLLPGRAGGVDTLSLVSENWTLQQPIEFASQPVLSWHRFDIPPGYTGEATLLVHGLELARYIIHDVPRTFEPPPIDVQVGVDFPDVGELVGATINRISPDDPLIVTLVWKAAATPDTAYTVFVQLIGQDGAVLTQSDAMPAGNTRPTTGWLTGEYVVDQHRLNVPPFEGAAYLIVGLYDAAAPGLPRLETSDAADHIRLPIDLKG